MQWLYADLKCLACEAATLAPCADGIRCTGCKTTYPVLNDVPLLMPPGSFTDAAETIARNIGAPPVAAVEQALGSALRYRLNDVGLRAEFSNIVERYAPIWETAQPSTRQADQRQVELVCEYFNPHFAAGVKEYRSFRIRNMSNEVLSSSGTTPFHISYWLRAGDRAIEGVRSTLPIPLLPQREITVPVAIQAPQECGAYDIQVGLVQEFVGWSPSFFHSQLDVGPQRRTRPNLVTPPHAGAFDFVEDRNRSGDVLRRALSFLGLDEAKILEVACGNDPVSLRYYQPGTKVVACDLSFPQAQLGSLMFRSMNVTGPENYAFVSADFMQAPFRDGMFDVVVISAALHHFPDTVMALNVMVRLLRPGGLVVLLREPGKVVPDDPRFIQELADGFNEQQFELAEYETMYQRAGLTPVYEQLDFECSYKAICRTPLSPHTES